MKVTKRCYSGIGGQAVLEGVMMRNRSRYAVAVRKPDGEISVTTGGSEEEKKQPVLFRIPIIRGVVAFVDSLVLGMKTLTYSSSILEEEGSEEDDPPRTRPGEFLGNILIVLLSVVLAVVFFMLLPFGVAELFRARVHSETTLALIEGGLRILLFLGYVVAISLMSDIRRVFMYHGAEHKAINCVENGLPLTLENVRRQKRYHKRCGTSFLLIVILVSVIFFLFIYIDDIWLRMLYRILLIPAVAGVAFELISYAGRTDNIISDLFSAPGMWLQRLTTREPDDGMIEVAIASVEAVFDWREFQENAKKKSQKGRDSSRTASDEDGADQEKISAATLEAGAAEADGDQDDTSDTSATHRKAASTRSRREGAGRSGPAFGRKGRKSRSQSRRELEEREKKYRNRAAERARQQREQEEREAAHERAYQAAKKRKEERLAAIKESSRSSSGPQPAPRVEENDENDLKSLDHFFDEE